MALTRRATLYVIPNCSRNHNDNGGQWVTLKPNHQAHFQRVRHEFMPRISADLVAQATAEFGLEFQRVDVGAGAIVGASGGEAGLFIFAMVMAD